MLAEMLGMTKESDIPKDGKKTYRKRQVNVKDTDVIKKHLADLRESHIEKKKILLQWMISCLMNSLRNYKIGLVKCQDDTSTCDSVTW